MLDEIKSKLNFGYKSPMKKIATRCAYTGKLFDKHNPPTFEHIRPHSKGGKTNLSNCLVTLQKPNNDRGSMPFYKWLLKFPFMGVNIQKYLDELRGVKVEGVDYVEAVKPILNAEAKGVVIFRGRHHEKS